MILAPDVAATAQARQRQTRPTHERVRRRTLGPLDAEESGLASLCSRLKNLAACERRSDTPA